MTDSSRISSVNYVFALGELKMHPYRTSEATRARSGSIRLNISQSVIRVVTIATLCLLGFSAAAAQRWQYDYGRQCVEHGRKGVQPVGVNPAFGFPAGYIAVGQTNSPTLCGTTDVYVIRTDLNGATVWEAVFNIAGNDIGYDIHEGRFAPPGLPGAPAPAAGDLIIAGTTAGPVCGGTRINDAFLLRINAAGTVVKWLQTYGTAQGQEDAYDLVEATTGNNAFSTAPGDIVFSGLARNNAGSADGYIVRVKGGTGAQIWGMTYGGNANDEFRGVDEATVNLAAGATGDILAAGMSASFGGANQVMLVRVNGNNGLIGAAPQGSLIYGSNNFLDRAFAVQELTVGGNAGNIIVAGTTRGVPAGSASTNLEILLLKTGPSPCNVLLDQMYGDNGARQDFAMDVREIVSAGADRGHRHLAPPGHGLRVRSERRVPPGGQPRHAGAGRARLHDLRRRGERRRGVGCRDAGERDRHLRRLHRLRVRAEQSGDGGRSPGCISHQDQCSRLLRLQRTPHHPRQPSAGVPADLPRSGADRARRQLPDADGPGRRLMAHPALLRLPEAGSRPRGSLDRPRS